MSSVSEEHVPVDLNKVTQCQNTQDEFAIDMTASMLSSMREFLEKVNEETKSDEEMNGRVSRNK